MSAAPLVTSHGYPASACRCGPTGPAYICGIFLFKAGTLTLGRSFFLAVKNKKADHYVGVFLLPALFFSRYPDPKFVHRALALGNITVGGWAQKSELWTVGAFGTACAPRL
jgi:hypothetical protein